ncbi:hypothetical protein DFH09DRAFT_1085590 [Mycena vulgaris]|nr:hypothetical protein DFH09DRAFT_1085590 [Mycena vulgaris]
MPCYQRLPVRESLRRVDGPCPEFPAICNRKLGLFIMALSIRAQCIASAPQVERCLGPLGECVLFGSMTPPARWEEHGVERGARGGPVPRLIHVDNSRARSGIPGASLTRSSGLIPFG